MITELMKTGGYKTVTTIAETKKKADNACGMLNMSLAKRPPIAGLSTEMSVMFGSMTMAPSIALNHSSVKVP